jgi:Type IV secretion-system coupling protein DNA-binding domain
MRQHQKGTPVRQNRGQEIALGAVRTAARRLFHRVGFCAAVGVGVGCSTIAMRHDLDSFLAEVGSALLVLPEHLFLDKPLPEFALLSSPVMTEFLVAGSLGAALAFGLSTVLFQRIGKSANQELIRRGRQVLSAKELNAEVERWAIDWLGRYAKANPGTGMDFHESFDLGEAFGPERRQILFERYWTVGDAPNQVYLPEIIQYQHLGISGSTGTGKSVLFEHLVAQDQEDPDTIGLVLDYGGLLYQKFGRPGEDRILGMFDHRAAFWDFWNEPVIHKTIAEALIEEDPGDKFFAPAARNLFVDLLNMSSTVAELWTLITLPFEELKGKLTAAGAMSVSNFASDKQAAGVLTSMQNYLDSLRNLNFHNPHGSPFSIVDWVHRSRGGWTYIIVSAEERPLLKPWLRLWVDLAIAGALRREVSKRHKRLRIYVDELPEVGFLPSLPTALTNGRKFGVSCVLGYQSEHQIEEVNKAKSASMISCIRTRFFFNPEDDKSAESNAKHFGRIEAYEMNESDNFGDKNQSEGVGWTERSKYLIDPSQLTSLDKHECYLKMPKFDPTKLWILPTTRPSRNAPYEPKIPAELLLNRGRA